MGVNGVGAQLCMGVYYFTLVYFNIVFRIIASVSIKSRDLLIQLFSSDRVFAISGQSICRTYKVLSNSSGKKWKRLNFPRSHGFYHLPCDEESSYTLKNL